jgi:thiosulfate dehydrogenase
MIRNLFGALMMLLLVWGGRGSLQNATAMQTAPVEIPVGAYGDLVRYGRSIITDTQRTLPANVKAAMSCEACHLAAGTKAHGGSLVGVYAEFPQWNKRAHRFISLQDRLAECFLYSMNGRPPAFESREMEALVAYVAWLSRGQAVGMPVVGQGYVRFAADRAPSAAAGARTYAARCAACHGAEGAGSGAIPPLWGDRSFNAGAGMHRLSTMAAFVRYNMPFGAPPNTLSKQEAYDVAAYVLAQPRPRFDAKRAISFPSVPAAFF